MRSRISRETEVKHSKARFKGTPIIDADGHVRETDEEIMEFMSAGYRCLLSASDFPHEATRTDMRKLVKEFFDRKDLARAAKKKILYDNPKRFYAL